MEEANTGSGYNYPCGSEYWNTACCCYNETLANYLKDLTQEERFATRQKILHRKCKWKQQ